MSYPRAFLLVLAAVAFPALASAQPPAPPGDAPPAEAPPAAAPPAEAPAAEAPPAVAQPAEAQPAEAPAAEGDAAAQPVYYTRSFDFEEVDVSRVAAQLRSFGIPVPVQLDGTATVNLAVSIPITQLTNARAYRVQGTIQSEQLRVADFRFGDLAARLSIENGVLRLTNLAGTFLEPPSPLAPAAGAASPPLRALGSFEGTAMAQLIPLGQFTSDLRVRDLDVRFVDQFLADPVPEVDGVLAGNVELSAPVDQIADLSTFRGKARLESERLVYGDLHLAEATANLQLNQGVAELTSLEAELRGTAGDVSRGTVRGSGTLEVAPLGELAVDAELNKLDLGLLADIADAAPGQVTGTADVSVNASVPAPQAEQITAWSGEGQFTIDSMVVRPTGEEVPPAEVAPAATADAQTRVIDSAQGEFALDAGTFTADPLVLEFAESPLRGRLSVRLLQQDDQRPGWTAAIRTESMEVAELLRLLAGSAPADTSGTVSLDLEASGPLAAGPNLAGEPAESPPAGLTPADAPPTDAPPTDLATEDAAAPSADGWQVAGTIAGEEIFVSGFRLGPLAHQLEATDRRLALEPQGGADLSQLLLQSVRADYAIGEDQLRLDGLQLQGWDGNLSGEAVWSLVDSGRHRAVLDWSDLNFTFRGNAVAAADTTLETITSGHIEWTAPAEQLQQPAAHAFRLRAELRDVQTAERELGAFEVTVDAQTLPWQLRGSGSLLEVPTEITATLPVARAATWEELSLVPASGSLVAGPFSVAPLLDRLMDDEDELAESRIGGTAAFRLDAQATPAGAPRLSAELAIEQLAYRGEPVAAAFTAASGVVVADGRVRLTDIRGALHGTGPETPPLEYRGRAVAEMSSAGELALELAADGADLAWFNPWFPDGIGPLDGAVQGTVRAAVPLDRIGQVAAWRGVADLSSPQFQMEDLRVRDASAELVLKDAVLVVDPILGVVNDVALAANAAVELETDEGPGGGWEMRLQTGSAPAEDVLALLAGTAPADTSGFVSFDVLASGWAPTDARDGGWQAAGEVSGHSLVVAGVEVGRLQHELHVTGSRAVLQPLESAEVNRLRLKRFAADYAAEGEGWRLDQFRLEGWGGTASGSATWSGDPAIHHAADLTWSDLLLPIPMELVGEEGPEIQMLTGGSLRWTAPPAELGDPSAHRFSLEAQAQNIQLDETSIGDLYIRADAMDPAAWELRGEGTLLRGPAELTATVDVSQIASWEQLPSAPADGQLLAGPMEIGELFQLWQPDQQADQWSGTAALRWVVSTQDPSRPRSYGELRIEDLQFGQRDVIDRVQVELVSTSDRFDIRSLRGSYAGGRIEGSGRWTMGSGPRQLVVRLASVDASRALLPISPDSDEWLEGRLSGDLVIAGREGLRITGRMELRDGEAFDVDLGNVRTNVRASVALPSLRWTLQLPNVRVSRGQGRIVGEVQLTQSHARRDRFDLDSEFEATNLDFQEMLSEVSGGGSPTLGSGSLTGVVTLSGRSVASFADLEGRVLGRLDGTDATAVPGLLSAENYLGVLSLRNTEFNRGAIEARLRLGELQISDLWLSSDQLRVWAEGDVSLRSGRLDIDAVAATGNFEQGNAPLVSLARTFALEAALPVSVITRANELLSNRVVQLSIGGTYRRPAVRVRPVGTLTENAARFFLREAAGIALPGAGVGAFSGDR